ncbi:MAG: hypothetical protein JO049_05915 [Hyphomicrobiales bacterium]|jgi:hypothetical protein|nr:hypothetical protein [Hyphomicrobiales bacterium]
MLPPLADRPHEDRPAREESCASGTRLLRDPKLPRLLRAANVLISLTGIAYFLSFLAILQAPVSWIDVAWHLFTQLLIITPQIFPLVLILITEAMTVGTIQRHALIFALAIAMIGLGHFWTTGVIAAINS